MRDQGGFTIIELVISIMVFGIVLAGAIGFVAQQSTLFHRGLDRMTALQNLRYALGSLETDIPTLGTNVPTEQPSLVYADDDVIAFTGDYASNIPNDVFATFLDLGAPDGQVSAPMPSLTIPNSSYTWPDTLYQNSAGTRSPAELLMFWFVLDVTTVRADDYVLFRQVNSATPEPLARNLLTASDGTPFFSYMRRLDAASAPSSLIDLPDSALPVAHTSTFHRVPADTAASALADSIRAVRVSLRSTNGLSGENERIVEASRLFAMPNSGSTLLQTCGDEPMLGDTLGAAIEPDSVGGYVARLTWNAAIDETAGERDVSRYVIYRQSLPMSPDWGDPYLSIPAGLLTYQYDDQAIVSGESYIYALAAQDCTPMLSTLEQSGFVIVP